MAERPNRSVLITGASTGIGAATAKYLAGKGWRVFGGYRKAEDAEPLRQMSELVQPVRMDVTKPEDIEAAAATVAEALQGDKLGGLVNNAGIAFMAPLALQPMDEFKAHFEVNTFGLLASTQAMLPLLGMDTARAGGPGRIINITSVGGKLASPFLGAYVATKHAGEAITDTLRRELIVYSIEAIAIGPGAVKTPIWEKAEEKEPDTAYRDSAWGESIDRYQDVMLNAGKEGLPPEDVARAVEKALTAKKPKARYAPVPDKLTKFTIPTRLPKRWVDRIFASRFGIARKYNR